MTGVSQGGGLARMTEMDAMEAMTAQFADAALPFSDPEGAAARATAEPMAMYVERAARCPVERLQDDYVVLLRMADILYVNKHHDVEQASKYLGSSRPAIPLGLDGEEHRKYRRLLDPVFTAKRVAPLADNVRALADEMIDGFVDRGEVKAYEQWCEPLPSTIFLSILGLPVADLDDFLHFKSLTLGNEFATLPFEEAMARREDAVVWIHDYFNRLLDDRLGAPDPGDDLLGWLLTTEVEGERLPREDLLDILGLLMIAGLDTVAASLACFLSHLARHPDERAQLVADPSRWPSAIEELLRFESPVTDGGRIALADLELPSGEPVAAGTRMGISWHAANLDPDFFTDPLTVDFGRAPNPHIAFASGFHRCLGSHLARMEMQVALEAWHERIPDYSIAAGSDLTYSGNPRAPHHLTLTW
jgi:cytochrome P450